MPHHRIADIMDRSSPVLTAEPKLSLTGFMVCPIAIQEWLRGQDVQWQIYQKALEQALALARPSILDRLQACLLN